MIVTAVAVAALVTAGGVAYASARGAGDGGDIGEHQAPIADADLAKATAAALAQTGGGRVTSTEVGDEESYYEVEVTLDDGSQIDVQLDEQFAPVGGSTDVEGPPDSES